MQEDRTGCAIASVAAVTEQRYAVVKSEAEALGISVSDPKLWSDPTPMRRLLTHFSIRVSRRTAFSSWDRLPDCALLAIKWHVEKSGPAWHWVVFVRDESGGYVLDPKKALRSNRRTDFGRMKPKWFIGLSS